MGNIELDKLHIIRQANNDGWSKTLCGLNIDCEFDNYIKINNKISLSLVNDSDDVCAKCLNELYKIQSKG